MNPQLIQRPQRSSRKSKSKFDNRLTNIIDQDIGIDDIMSRPVFLIAMYQNSNGAYLEIADVDNQGKPGAFKAMTADMINKMVHTLAQSDKRLESYVPDGLKYFSLHADNTVSKLLFVTPPQKKYLTFGNKETEKSKDGYLNVPWLLWYWYHNELCIYAMLEAPGPNTLLYHAPFYNLYEVGAVCFGDGRKMIKGDTVADYMQSIQDAFWKTEFTYPHCKKFLRIPENKWKQEYMKYINSDKTFDDSVLWPLVPAKVDMVVKTHEKFKTGMRFDEQQTTYNDLYHSIREK
jgi:PRTRC genetic system protein B